MTSNHQHAKCDQFWGAASAQRPGLPEAYEVRRIGTDAETTSAILRLIVSGDKTGSVHVPEVFRQTGEPRPAVGDGIILLDANNEPALAVTIASIEDVPYAEITEAHTAVDGPRVRQLDIWKKVHHPYFNQLLAPFGLSCDAQTPIAFETFRIEYPAPTSTR